MTREVVAAQPVHVARHGRERVADAGQDEHVEALVRLHERSTEAIRVRRMHVVVDVTVISIRLPFRFLASSEFFSMSYSKVTLPSFSTSLMPTGLLAPRVVVDVVLVVVDQLTLKKSGYTSIAAADMKPPPEWPQIPTLLMSMNEVAGGELLDGGLLVREAVVAQVAVAVVVVPPTAADGRAVADLDDGEPELRERDVAARIEVLRHAARSADQDRRRR